MKPTKINSPTLRLLALTPFLLPVIAVGWCVYFLANANNPDSWLCTHKIYKQPDGTYQVWWVCRSRYMELSGATYDQAKSFQSNSCWKSSEFMKQRPKGERIK